MSIYPVYLYLRFHRLFDDFRKEVASGFLSAFVLSVCYPNNKRKCKFEYELHENNNDFK